MQGRVSALVLAVAAMLAFAVPARAAETFTVTGFEDTSESCQGTSCPSIRSALIQASISPGVDTVSIPAGDYQLQSALPVNNDVVVRGASARTTILRGGQGFRAFEIPAGITATISHLTMSGGSITCWGGNLFNEGTVTLDHIRATQGSACSGGGLANAGGTMTVLSSLIDHNTSFQGGADSGAIANIGVAGHPTTLTVRDSTLAFNNAGNTGGILAWNNSPGAVNDVTLERVTVAYNSGGGINRGAGTTFTVRSSIVSHNSPYDCAGGVADGGHNLESASTCGFAFQNAALNLSDELTDQGGETDTLSMGAASQAVDAGGDCTGTDQRDLARPQGEACDSGALEVQSGVTIGSGPAGSTNLSDAAFSFTSAPDAVAFECRLDTGSDQQAYSPCTSPQTYSGLRDGNYTFLELALDANGTPVGAPAARTFSIDTTPPAAPVIGSGGGGVLSGTAEPYSTIEILEGGAVVGRTTAGDDGVWSFALPDSGPHTYSVRATDAVGNASPLSAPVSVGTFPAQPTPTPSPTPTPAASPVPQKSVAGQGPKTVLVRVPGGKFVPLDPSKPIPLGSTIDATKGAIVIFAVLKKGGKVEQARFFDGIFKITQTQTTTDLTLNEALAKCSSKASAAAAKKKPKSRKLWGEGSGSFRTRGQYSAATVRGTKWLVQDSCSGTLTRVSKGVVAVRDNVKRKTIVLRAGKSYLARPKRR
jgi:hypothetical protein